MNTILLLCLAAQGAPSSTKEAMKPIQLLVGEWRTQVAPDDDKEGAWEETQSWEYLIEKDVYSLQVTVKDGKKFKSGVLSYDLKKKIYRLEAVRANDQKATFEGTLSGKDLTLEEKGPDTQDLEKLVFTLLRDNRILAAIEKKPAGKKGWQPTHSLQATKQGVPFVRTEAPKCVITGGSPMIEVQHQGKTYFVCCNSCRKEFQEDPAKAIAQGKKEGYIK